MLPERTCPSTVALEARLSHDRFSSGTGPGKCELSESVEPGGRGRLSLACSTVVENKCILVPALCREGLFLVYCIREIKHGRRFNTGRFVPGSKAMAKYDESSTHLPGGAPRALPRPLQYSARAHRLLCPIR